MSIKEIITVPDPILKKISSPIEKISINEKKLIKDLKDTMYNANGIGLAAIQIGIPKRIVIVDVTKEDEKKNLHCLINPKIKKFSDDRSSYEEGCLSIPNTFIQIERPREIEIEYIDEDGKKFVWREWDCHMNLPFKSDDWKIRDRMLMSFVPKDEILEDGSQIITRLKKI